MNIIIFRAHANSGTSIATTIVTLKQAQIQSLCRNYSIIAVPEVTRYPSSSVVYFAANKRSSLQVKISDFQVDTVIWLYNDKPVTDETASYVITTDKMGANATTSLEISNYATSNHEGEYTVNVQSQEESFIVSIWRVMTASKCIQ